MSHAAFGRSLQDAHPIEEHPLLVRLASGDLPPERIRAVALQVGHVGAAFPRFLAAVMANLADWRLRMPLARNLLDEHGRLDPRAVHVQTYRVFLRGLGLSDEDIDASAPIVPVIAYNRALLDLCVHHPPQEALGALAVVEGIVSRAAPVVVAATAPLISDRAALAHFDEHGELDVDHAGDLYDVLEALGGDPELARRGMALGDYYHRRLYTDLLGV